ncbi:hypothetical protein AK812_SmicGene33871 [Symbiodinium microadriaticum]|uniref:Uncharacterized protein n=1 Tax=Symbiodinium microadriaticum TaxID=2951 RepID=A0A1Q9CQG5_SYMMI|nr:hypothetical protein AK812_SmicGene33871 [Symbiodinium microadriaticum]
MWSSNAEIASGTAVEATETLGTQPPVRGMNVTWYVKSPPCRLLTVEQLRGRVCGQLPAFNGESVNFAVWEQPFDKETSAWGDQVLLSKFQAQHAKLAREDKKEATATTATAAADGRKAGAMSAVPLRRLSPLQLSQRFCSSHRDPPLLAAGTGRR